MKVRYWFFVWVCVTACLSVSGSEARIVYAAATGPPECIVKIQRFILSDGSEICLDQLTYYTPGTEYFRRGEHPAAQHPVGRIALPTRFRLVDGSILEPRWYTVGVFFKPGADKIVFTRTRGMELLQSTYKGLAEDINYRVSHADADGDGHIDEKERQLAFERPAPLKLEDTEAHLVPYSGGPSAMDDRSTFPECSTVVSEVRAPLDVKEIETARERASLDIFPAEEPGTFVLEITFGLYQGRTSLSLVGPTE